MFHPIKTGETPTKTITKKPGQKKTATFHVFPGWFRWWMSFSRQASVPHSAAVRLEDPSGQVGGLLIPGWESCPRDPGMEPKYLVNRC